MFGIFKRKSKQEEVDSLNETYKDILDCYCMAGDYIFAPKKFEVIKKNEHSSYVALLYIDQDTPEDCHSVADWDLWELRYGSLYEARNRFIRVRNNFSKVGLKIVKKEKN